MTVTGRERDREIEKGRDQKDSPFLGWERRLLCLTVGERVFAAGTKVRPSKALDLFCYPAAKWERLYTLADYFNLFHMFCYTQLCCLDFLILILFFMVLQGIWCVAYSIRSTCTL